LLSGTEASPSGRMRGLGSSNKGPFASGTKQAKLGCSLRTEGGPHLIGKFVDIMVEEDGKKQTFRRLKKEKSGPGSRERRWGESGVQPAGCREKSL